MTDTTMTDEEFDDLIIETRTALGVQAIYYANILYDRLAIVRRDNISTLATDGSRIFINGDYLKSLP